MQYTSLDELTAETLNALIGEEAEGKRIEYKQELPGKDEEDKAEFLKDVTAFANTDGGDIIYGMAAVKGIASKLFPVENKLIDDAKLKLHQVLDGGVTPRVPGIDMIPVEVERGKSVLVVRVPASHIGPHQVTAAHSYRFYGRNTAGTYAIEVDELRDKILRQASLPERMNDFRRSRVELIKNHPEDMPCPVDYERKLVVHYMPEQTFGRTAAVNAAMFAKAENQRSVVVHGLPVRADIGVSYRSNIDGYVFMNGRGDDILKFYAQVFNDGTLEFVDGTAFYNSEQDPYIYHLTLEKNLFLEYYFARAIFDTLGITGRIAIYATALGLRECTIKPQAPTRTLDFVKHSTAIGRDPAHFNPIIIEDMCELEPEAAIEPLVQQFWRASAYSHAYSYEGGAYIANRW